MTDDQVERGFVEPVAREVHRGHRGLYVAAAAFAFGLVVAAWVLFSQYGEIRALETGNAQRDGVISQLAQQVKGLGGTPVVQAPQPGAQGPVGTQGPVGPQGPPGPTGPQGPAGRDGQSPPCLADPAQCQGAAGQNGIAGPAGATGPAGPAGSQGPAGPAGPQGPSGPAGSTGAQGPPGPTCPDGYSPQSRQQGLETWWVCVADSSGPTATIRK